jgi:P-type Ca2+ transporter type 2C
MKEEVFNGLTDEQVQKSRKTHGSNKIAETDTNEFFATLKEIILEPLFLILILTASLYFLLGEKTEGLVMIFALLFVSGISLFQENKSRKAVNSLKKLSDPTVYVFRSGKKILLPVDQLVVDDIFSIEDGNIVPADAMILQQNDFSVNESIITGESLPVFKNVDIGTNQLFSGTLVVSGSCLARVTNVGKASMLGKIGSSIDDIKTEKTPLQLQISKFIKTMVIFGSIAFLIVWILNYVKDGDVLQSLLKGLTLAMSVLPEEIPVAFSTFMALGAYHLYKKKVIARSPMTVETLGAATVICTDKTGTLTENKMQLATIYDFTKDELLDYNADLHPSSKVLEYAMWASEIEPFDTMEKSIHAVYSQVYNNDLRPHFKMFREYPLSGKPPVMTHVYRDENQNHIIAVKGSVEGVLNISKLSSDQKKQILQVTEDLAAKGYRVLGVGKSDMGIDSLPEIQQDISFQFLGLVAFYDPPKHNIHRTLDTFNKAGISVKMITGDHAGTAMAIANEVGILHGDHILTGEEVMGMTDDELRCKIVDVNVYARMFPDAKLRVINSLKSNGEVVAMTGDGVNDGPALKAAHIGIAMGNTGSDVAKSAASLILMDDDLSHMVDAVALGRKIYENLKKAIRYIISIHIPIILVVTLPLILGWVYTDIFTPIHVIFLELIMGPTCSIIFENEPIEKNSMSKPPRKMTTDFFSFRELFISIIQGLIITIVCLGLGYFFMAEGGELSFVRTIIFTTLILSNVFLTLVNRSFFYSVFTTIRYKNNLIPLVIFISLTVLFLSIYFAPVQRIFGLQALGMYHLGLCFATSFVGVLWVEGYKVWVRTARK